VGERVDRVSRFLSVLLALVLPVLIIGTALAGLERYRTMADNRENRNAGKVINGRVAEGGVVQAIDRTLVKYDPEIILLGNSLSNTDLETPLLAARLGIPKNKVQKFSIPNSIAAHWYAILKNRVYANGHRPKVVLILSDMQSALAITPRSEASYLNLAVHLGDNERVIDDKLGARNWYLERARENRGTLRDQALTAARNAMVDLLFHRSFAPTDGWATDAALQRVFDASRTDMRLHHQAIPIMQTESMRDLVPFDPDDLPTPTASFIPEIVKLVARNGGHVVFLRPPMSPLLPEEGGDLVLPESEKQVVRMVERLGGTYLDLRTLDMDHFHFHNLDHMNTEGARRFTETVSDLLLDVKAGGYGAAGPGRVELLKNIRVEDGGFEHWPYQVAFKDDPPPVPRSARGFQAGRGRMVYFASDSFSFLSDLATVGVTPHTSRCSPLRVLEDGVPLGQPNVSCDEAWRQGYGRTCHTPERLYFTTPDDSDPFTNGRDYTIGLDPDRACDSAVWLYPHDKMRLTVREGELAGVMGGASTLTVFAVDMGSSGRGGELVLDAKLRVGQGIRADGPMPIESLREGGVLKIEPRIGAAAYPVTVDLTNRSDRFLLVTSVRLSEPGRAGGANRQPVEPPE
jgi:hypothetical protein